MSARQRLDAIAARLEAATPGPWEPYRTRGWDHDNYVVRPDGQGVAMQYALVWAPGDADFIAHAPTDLAAMHAALTAVLALHQPEVVPRIAASDIVHDQRCTVCLASDMRYGDDVRTEDYHCPTVSAVEAALQAKEGS